MKIVTVSELTSLIKNSLETQFAGVWVEAEICNLKIASSGHIYLTLKDDQAQLKSVLFRGSASKLKFRPENGLSVVCQGSINVYEPRGEYQLIIQHMEPQGLGALQLAFEQLKKKLEAEGLFDIARKRAIPFLPRKIAIVTSPTGAVIRDIFHVLQRRFPMFQAVFYPVAVQGTLAAPQIVKAIQTLNRINDEQSLGIDVMIVGRGGGSMEDLWAFNEEIVARAIAASSIPIISAVGHETDFTIADFVADVRAPTPSAAAEIAIPVKEDLHFKLMRYQKNLTQLVHKKLDEIHWQLKRAQSVLKDPQKRFTESLLRLDHLDQLLRHHITQQWERMNQRCQQRKIQLTTLDPKRILSRGYAVLLNDENRPITTIEGMNADDKFTVVLNDGKMRSQVLSVTSK